MTDTWPAEQNIALSGSFVSLMRAWVRWLVSQPTPCAPPWGHLAHKLSQAQYCVLLLGPGLNIQPMKTPKDLNRYVSKCAT